MKTKIKHLLLLLVIISCSDNASTILTIDNPRIRAAFEKRKAEYAAEVMRNCQQDVLLRAETYVDSIISADIDFRINDSIVFPEKPIKPDWPGAIIVSDTIKARPLFK